MDNDSSILRVDDEKALQAAFEFKCKEVRFFVEQITELKRKTEQPFRDRVYSDALHNDILTAIEPKCEDAAFLYSAVLGATFSALDCFAKAHTVIERSAKSERGRSLKRKDIKFIDWIRRLREQLPETRFDAVRTRYLEPFLELAEGKLMRYRQARNFYIHERHPIQDMAGSAISTVDGNITGISLPLLWYESGDPAFIDDSSEEIWESLHPFALYARDLEPLFVTYSKGKG